MLIDWTVQSNLRLHLLLTKADKLKRGAAQNSFLRVEKELADYAGVTVQLFSSLKQAGVDTARKTLSDWLCSNEPAA